MVVRVFIFFIFVIGTSIGCNQTLRYSDPYGEAIPFSTLDVCLQARLDGNYWSVMYKCSLNNDKMLKQYIWDNSNCSGDTFMILPSHINHDEILQCSNDQIECQYAIIRIFMSNSDDNVTDFADQAFPVNFCVETTVDIDSIDNSIYVTTICNKSTIQNVMYQFSGCSNDPLLSDSMFSNCSEYGDYCEIIYCDSCNECNINTTKTAIQITVIEISIIVICLVYLVISLCFTFKLFQNLYEFDRYKIVFSDKLNWIIEPSSSNKIYAIFSVMCYNLHFVLYMIFVILTLISEYYYVYNNINVIKYLFYGVVHWNIAGDIFYYSYIRSTLKYLIDSEELIKNMISKRSMRFLQLLIYLVILLFVIDFMIYCFDYNLWMNPPNFTYLMYFKGIKVVLNIILEINVSYLYYSGLNNVCHFWYSKHWEEYDKYGENERIHEILINISRVAVSIMSSVIMSFVATVSYLILIFTPTNYIMAGTGTLFVIILILSYEVTRTSLIFFIYPFGHKDYKKICNKCDRRMYNYFQKKHQDQVKNGAFDDDGNIYVPFSKLNEKQKI